MAASRYSDSESVEELLVLLVLELLLLELLLDDLPLLDELDELLSSSSLESSLVVLRELFRDELLVSRELELSLFCAVARPELPPLPPTPGVRPIQPALLKTMTKAKSTAADRFMMVPFCWPRRRAAGMPSVMPRACPD